MNRFLPIIFGLWPQLELMIISYFTDLENNSYSILINLRIMPRNYKRKGKRLRQLQRRYYKANTPYSSFHYMARQIGKLKGMINVEYKNKYTQLTASVTGDTPAFFSLVNMIKGDDDNLRQGNQIRVKLVYLNALIKINASATNTTLRYMIILDKQCNGVNPTAPELFQDNTVNDIMVSPLNPDNKFRFRILYNKLVKLSTTLPTVQLKKYLKVDYIIRYDGNAGTTADITSNNLIVLLFSDEVTNDPTVTHNIRMSYIDN